MADSKQHTYARFIYEYPAPGIVQEWAPDKSLCIFVIDNSRQETIDSWSLHTKQVLNHWDAERPCFVLHDLQKVELFTFNSQLQQKFDELYKFRSSLERFVAVVLPANLSTYRLAQLSVRVRELTASPDYPVHWKMFMDRQDALTWLLRWQREKSNSGT